MNDLDKALKLDVIQSEVSTNYLSEANNWKSSKVMSTKSGEYSSEFSLNNNFNSSSFNLPSLSKSALVNNLVNTFKWLVAYNDRRY